MTAKRPKVPVFLGLFMWARRYYYIGRITRYSAALLVYISIWLILDHGNLFPTFIGFTIALLSTLLLALFLFVDVIFLVWRKSTAAQSRAMRRTDAGIFFLVFIPIYLAAKLYFGAHIRSDFGFDIHRLVTNVMAPTLLKGEYVLTDTRAYRRSGPGAGEIVQLSYENKDYIRRVLSVSNNSLQVSSDGSLERGDTNHDLLTNVEIPLSAVKGRLTYIIFSSDLKRIGSKITESDQLIPDTLPCAR